MTVSVADTAGLPVAWFPKNSFSLYSGAVAMAQCQSLKYLFTLTEARLAQHLANAGITVHAVGSPIEHRGMRVPSMMLVSEGYPNLLAPVPRFGTKCMLRPKRPTWSMPSCDMRRLASIAAALAPCPPS